MMKKMTFFVVTLLLLFALTSCGKNSYVGTYKFQLGKEKGTHFAITLVMTDEEDVKNDIVRGKKFTFSVSSNGVNEESVEGNTDDEISDITNNLLSNASVTGYYNLEERNVPYGRQSEDKTYVRIGITGFEAGDLNFSEKDIESFELTPEIVEQVIYIEINEKVANVVVPVSVQDLMFQFYWYGYDFNMNEQALGEETTQHQIGTHPTQEDIDEINKTYPDKHNGKKFRDFHTMVMGLSRV